MRVAALDYELPEALIAQHPAREREAARLMILPATGETTLTTMGMFDACVPEGSLVVVNDTRVLHARILGSKEGTGGRTEIFLVKKIAEAEGRQTWHAMGRASKALKPGMRIAAPPLAMEIQGRTDEGLYVVSVTAAGSIDDAIQATGRIPLPPYIKRDPAPEDEARYQTVFSRGDARAVAAPTAGLHLSTALLDRLRARGCEVAHTTLHVGLGTFQPVTVDDLDDHPMHSEWFEVTGELAAAVARARERSTPVVAVGTTVVRALESAADSARPGLVRPCAEETRILLQPGSRFAVVDRLLTNFHLPKSTLLALVCAFGGTDRVLAAYRRAVEERFRFFSYGDAMFLERRDDT